MDKLDLLFRAFTYYRQITKDSKELTRDRKKFNKDFKNDELKITKYLCQIDETWIKEIEEGLPYIEKAIAEERQFIRTDSEVVDIEKVKRVGRESVAHLAKHSNLISKELEDNEDLVPEKILMVEKESDYAVYENRFLYMLLCYLRDFIALRLQKIKKLLAIYEANFKVNKEIKLKKGKVTFTSTLYDYREDNPYPLADEKSKDLLKRIENAEQLINSLLNRPLIVEVSKTPMLKPPITRTNVLKKNSNFIHAVALYEFVANYNEDGFTSEKVSHDLIPLEANRQDELAEIYSLTSFLTYVYGNDLEEILKINYEEEEKRKAKAAEEELLRQIKKLKQKISEEGIEPYEYMLLVEKRNNLLEQKLVELPILENELKKKENIIIELNNNIAELTRQNEDLKTNLDNTIKIYEDKITNLNLSHNEEINNLINKQDEELNEIKNSYEDSINNLTLKYESEIKDLKESLTETNNKYQELKDNYDSYVDNINKEKEEYKNNLNKEYSDLKTELLNEIASKNNDLADKVKEFNEQKEEFKKLEDLRKAEHQALMIKYKELDKPYTDKEKFLELENNFLIFADFFKENWHLAKKEIRKRILWAKKK